MIISLVRSRPAAAASIAFAAAMAFASAVQAQRPPPGPRAHPPRPEWRGDIHRFHEHDWRLWRGGRWVHGPHGGRTGWWWVVGSVWYFYPAPVYPYPNPWIPPPAELVTPPPGAVPLPPPTQYWYFCESANAYYPYVPTCPAGWKQVPATPPPATPSR